MADAPFKIYILDVVIWLLSPELSWMLNMETCVKMVEGGPDCCRSVRRVHTGSRACSGRRALVQFAGAKARLKPALSSAARVEGPLP
jgi:hypothetical protein